MAQDSTSSPPPLRIALIGGGIGGLATLLGLLNHTSRDVIQTHLYEAASQFSEIGAGVAFGPNAVNAMGLVDPDLKAAYQSISSKGAMRELNGVMRVPWHNFVMGMDGQSERNGLKTLDEIPGATPFNDNRTKSVHRASFLEEMLKILRVRGMDGFVTFDKRCKEIEDLGAGKRLKIIFADGTEVEADAVVGCDGVKSRVRQILLDRVGEEKAMIEPRFTGKYAYRGLIPMEEAIAAIGEAGRENLMICGYGGHLVTFPIDMGKTFNVVAFTSPKNEKREWVHGDQWVVPSTIEDVLQDFEGWSEPVRKLLSMLRKPDKWGLFDHPPAKTYHQDGKLLLLGDCAHASTPHQGAGAGMAIEDAAVFSILMSRVEKAERRQLVKIFEAYDKARRLRTQKLVTTSRGAGLLYDFEHEGVGDDAEKFAKNSHHRFAWIWGFDVEKSCKEAIEGMKPERPMATL
jgi:salicylate hydroxylase